MRSIRLFVLTLFVVTACDDDLNRETSSDAGTGSPCTPTESICPTAQRCEAHPDGTYVCVETDMQTSDTSSPDRSPLDGGSSTDMTEADASTPAVDCETFCLTTLGCLPEDWGCDLSTDGRAQAVKAQCLLTCQTSPSLLTPQSSCESRAEALLTHLAALRTHCSVGVIGNGCRASDGSEGLCVRSDACPDAGQPERCLDDATCCTALTCGAEGRCGGEDRCVGRTVAGECDGTSSACCTPFQGAADACSQDDDCSSNECTTEAEAPTATPGGFCESACDETTPCEQDSICLESGGRRLCFSTCSIDNPCRDGWRCGVRHLADSGPEDGPMSVQVCLTDCRGQGCGRHGVCSQETGLRNPRAPPAQCPYPCAAEEVCSNGRCVRADATCASDYNCAVNWRCDDGRCTTGPFAACDADAMDSCADGQICAQTNEGMGVCLIECQDDVGCPVNMACQRFLGADRPAVCYYSFCDEAELNGQCLLGDRSGTCRPLGVQNAGIGLCLEAATPKSARNVTTRPSVAPMEHRPCSASQARCASGTKMIRSTLKV